jgi:glycosyltransferase involved in cell wall biosynthesis
MKKRILHLIPSLDRGGAEMSLIKLIQGSKERFDHEVMTFSNKGSMAHILEKEGIVIHSLNFKKIGYIKSLWRFMRFLRREKYHCLQTWMYHADIFGLVAGKLAGIKKIFWNVRCSTAFLQSSTFSKRGFLFFHKILSYLRVTIITNAHVNRDVHIKYGHRSSGWVVIPNAFDTERFFENPEARETLRQKLSVDKETILMGCVARYDVLKDHETFLKILCKLCAENPFFKGLLVGRDVGKIPFLNDYKRILGENLILLEEVSDSALIYPALDVHVLTSTSEGFPNVLGEAMACGVPCVASDVGDCRIIIEDDHLIAPIKDVDAFVKAIAYALKYRETISMKNQKRIRDFYALSKMIEAYESLYTEKN